MNHEHEQIHNAAATARSAAVDADIAPGRASRTDALMGAAGPSPSGLLMRKRDGNNVAANAESAVDAAATSTGSALPADLRTRFEGSLGTDLSGVRVHTGGASVDAASAVGAKAYTLGNDIHFGAGHFDTATLQGQHLIAHEVAHTVQQRGGSPTRQNKLEVSTPGDAFEHEADRAADAMVSGGTASVANIDHGVARQVETEADADAGEKQIMNGAAKTDLVMQVSNATDVADASRILHMLEDNQQLLEKGSAMIAPQQRSSGEIVQNIAQGKDNKPLTQIPLEAIGDNAALITDLQMYLVEAGGQTMMTSEFQDQYKVLLADYGRIQGVAKNYAGTDLSQMKPGDAGGVVENAVGASGNTTDQLAATFNQIKSDGAVQAAEEGLKNSTQTLEKMPATMTDNSSTACSALQAFQSNVVTATVAEQGVNSLGLRNAFAAAKAKAEEAKRLSGAVKDLLVSGGKSAGETAAKAVVGAGTLTLSRWGAIAAEGGASGGSAVAMAAADKLVIDPAKEMLSQALSNANAAVGIIDEKTQVDANLDAEQAKQDSATVQVFKTAKATLEHSSETAFSAASTWVKSAIEFEVQKTLVDKYFKALEDAIQKAATKSGKPSEGKALAEMMGFLKEAEQFVVQANVVIDTASKGAAEKSPVPQRAQAALDKIRNRYAWMAHSYPFTNAKGETMTYYGAEHVNLHIIGPGVAASPADLAGKSRADAFGLDPSANPNFANGAISDVVPRVTAMREKVLAVRTQIMSKVFGAGGGEPT